MPSGLFSKDDTTVLYFFLFFCVCFSVTAFLVVILLYSMFTTTEPFSQSLLAPDRQSSQRQHDKKIGGALESFYELTYFMA